MFEQFLGLSFWSSVPVHLAIGLVACLPIMFWDWRMALPGLSIVQWGVGRILVDVYGLPERWPTVYFWVIALSGLILLLSILQTGGVGVTWRKSSILFRTLVLGLAGLLLRGIELGGVAPMLDRSTALLLLWLVLCALLTLGMTDTALFTGIGLLLWLIPVQAFIAIILPLPALVALLGMLDLLVALACSYLMLAESELLFSGLLPLTDITFPDLRRSRHGIVSGLAVLWHGIGRRLALIGSVWDRSSH